MNKNRKKIYAVLGIVTLLVITISISYAYFTGNFSGGEEATTISVGGGSLKIVYNGGSNIVVSNIFPQDNAVAIKTFTVTGTNTTDLNMEYYLYLVVDENEFSDNSIRYKLISTNTDGNGNVAPSITEMQNILKESQSYDLGRGEFIGETSGDKVHTYKLEIYFPNESYSQNDEQGSTIKMHVEISGTPKQTEALLTELILAQGVDAATIEAKGNPNFATIATATDTGLYATEDEYGTSYYYRGEKDLLNNNLIFANHQWKIVRINGDGSIRIIYNGKCPGGVCTINNIHADTDLGATSILNSGTDYTHAWNTTNYNDAKYTGYMYGGANGSASGTKIDAQTNTTSTNAKTRLENWYESNIENQGSDIISKIVDNIYCNDRQISTGEGYGTETTIYGAVYRLETNKIPTLKCTNKNDRFTVSDVSLGNGALTYPVGLISADEASMAGLVSGTSNSTNYLNSNQAYWTFSPCGLAGDVAHVWGVDPAGDLSFDFVSYASGLRPILNLNSETTVLGEGTISSPYKVVSD